MRDGKILPKFIMKGNTKYVSRLWTATSPGTTKLFFNAATTNCFEVRATGIDFDGSVFYFPDIANKRIYTKQIGMDGTAILNMYEQKPLPQEAPAGTYITREELDRALRELKEEMRQPSLEISKPEETDRKAESPQYNF